MERSEFINKKIDKLMQFWIGWAIFFGAFFFIVLSILDYIATPENFTDFLKYRIFGALIFTILFILNRKKVNKGYQLFLTYSGVISSAVIIEYMILHLGGHSSPYYAGIFILIMVVVGFVPIGIKHSISLSIITLSVYIVPILIYDESLNFRTFSMPIFFLLSTLSIANIWRYLSQKRLIKELSLQYDIDKKKNELEIYSLQLEDLVSERTKELSISEQRFRALFDYANDGVVVFDKKGIILNVNKKFCELHSFEKDALVGANISLLEAENHEGEKKERMNRILNGESLIFETEHYRKDGSKILLEVSSKAIDIGGELYIQSFHRDITDKKRLQEQLFQSQKMESIGILAGGIAHDFNNILTAILGHAELLHEYSNLDDASLQRVKTIEGSARKAGQMITRLLSFARKRSLEVYPIDLNDVINDTIELIGKMMTNKKIDLKIEIDQRIPAINGDGNQMEQVIMNLIMNAADAMPVGGIITIKTSFADLKNGATHVHPLLSPGRYISLKITDTGTGIPDEIKSRIFDPFFTTKGPGKGTGLGLAMVYGIVKDHKGVINVESQLGKGATFEIYLPASDRAVQRVEKSAIYPTTGREKIMVIDDEEDVLSFIKEVLEKQGYRVMVTNNPIYCSSPCTS